MTQSKEYQKVALVLGSGGARGLAHIGVLKVLESQNIPIDLIVGCSIGAIVGGAYASGLPVRRIEKIAREAGLRTAGRIMFPSLPSSGFVDGRRVEEFIEGIVGNPLIENVTIPFAAVATNFLNGEEIVLEEGPLAAAIRASTSIPTLFKPARIGNRLLVDGGLVNPLPVDVAFDMGADLVIAVNVTPNVEYLRREGGFMQKLAARAKSTVVEKSVLAIGPFSKAAIKLGVPFVEQMRPFKSNRQSRTLQDTYRPNIMLSAVRAVMIMENEILRLRIERTPPNVLITPKVSGVSLLDFHKADLTIAAGEEAALSVLPALRTLISEHE